MDLEKNIEIAAEVYSTNGFGKPDDSMSDQDGMFFDYSKDSFIDGAKSQAAKDYWYNEFKAEKTQEPKPMHNLMEMFKTAEGILIVKPPKHIDFDKLVELIKGISKKPTFVQEDESGLGLHGMPFKVEFPKDYPWNEPVIMTGWKEYKEYMRDCPDPSFTFEDWKNMMTKYNQVTRKITDEISESVFGVAGHPIEIVLSEKWYQPNIFDKTDLYDVEGKSKGIIIGVGPGKSCMQESHILREYAKNGGVIIGVANIPNIGKGLRMDPITFKEMSIGITEQIKEVPIFDYTAISRDYLANTIIEDKPWDTKKQKRNNYKKKRRK